VIVSLERREIKDIPAVEIPSDRFKQVEEERNRRTLEQAIIKHPGSPQGKNPTHNGSPRAGAILTFKRRISIRVLPS
jgi:hypothetical protein